MHLANRYYGHVFFYKIKSMMLNRIPILTLLTSLCFNTALYAQNDLLDQQSTLLDLSLSDLMNLEITSAAKKKQKLSDSAAAAFIITKEDIRRSGATSLAEVLRIAPGLFVSRLNAYSWRVTSRGAFNGSYVDKVLIMIDGRSVYNLQFSNVFWDNLDMLLEDIERIEVIRGPGGPLWGANAVSGIVNIITRDAQDTQSTLLSVLAGDQDAYVAQARHGGVLDEEKQIFYRIYAKSRRYHDQKGIIISNADDGLLQTGGFRIDGHPSDATHWTFQGDAYHLNAGDLHWGDLQRGRMRINGGNVLARWSHLFDDNSELRVQSYYDQQRRFALTYGVINKVFDIEMQYRKPWDKHEWLWGLGYRWLYSDVPSYSLITRDELTRRDQLFSAFVQTDISLIPDKLNLILGSKFEHNDYTGVEIQPTIRLLWHPQDNLSFWGAVSRTVRTPSQVADHVRGDLNIAPPFNRFLPLNLVFQLQGNEEVESEVVLNYELGFRLRMSETLNWDVTAFYDRYRNLAQRVDTPVPDLANGRVLVLGQFQNLMRGKNYGLETTVNWQPIPRWQIKLSNTLLNSQMNVPADTLFDKRDIERGTPHVQWSIRNHIDLNYRWSLNLNVRYVGDMNKTTSVPISDYWALDVNALWQMNYHWDLMLSVSNVFDSSHPEYDIGNINPNVTENMRDVFVQLRAEF